MILFGANETLRLITNSTATLDVVASHATRASDTVTRAKTRTAISSATTTEIVAAPGSGNERTVFDLVIRNRHASLASTITVQDWDGSTGFERHKLTLAAGESAAYDGRGGWTYFNAQGQPKINQSQGVLAPTANIWNTLVLASDVVNNNAVANTIQDITGMSFAVLAGLRYRFRFFLDWTSAAGTTGARFSINGPAFSRLAYTSEYGLTATTETLNQLAAYDLPAAANANPANVAGNIALIEGIITPSADGTVIGRFASEVASSAITVKAGSMLEWMQVA